MVHTSGKELFSLCHSCSDVFMLWHNVIPTWTSTNPASRNLPQTSWEKFKNMSYALSFAPSFTPLLLWIMWLPSCCFDHGVALLQGQCISPCLLTTIWKHLFLSHTQTEEERRAPPLNLIELWSNSMTRLYSSLRYSGADLSVCGGWSWETGGMGTAWPLVMAYFNKGHFVLCPQCDCRFETIVLRRLDNRCCIVLPSRHH